MERAWAWSRGPGPKKSLNKALVQPIHVPVPSKSLMSNGLMLCNIMAQKRLRLFGRPKLCFGLNNLSSSSARLKKDWLGPPPEGTRLEKANRPGKCLMTMHKPVGQFSDVYS